MKGVSITDLTLTEFPYAPKKVALGLCRELCRMGVSFVEMTPSVFKRIEGAFPSEHVSLKIERLEEYFYYKGRGIHRFSVEAPGFTAYAEHAAVDCKDVFIFAFESDGENFDITAPASQKLRICGCDRVMQGDYVSAFSKLNEEFSEKLEFDPHDGCYTATAAALEFILNGGKNVCTSFCGAFGHAATEQLMAALNLTSGADFSLTNLPELRNFFESLWNHTLPCHMPVAGRGIFNYESGIHADGINKNPENYEPFDPKLVGAERKLVIGKHSGRSSIRQKLFEFGFVPAENEVEGLNREVRSLSEKNGRSLSDGEFLSLYFGIRAEALKNQSSKSNNFQSVP